MNYANGRTLSTAYDRRLRPTTWNVSSVLGYDYNYDHFNEHTGRVTYAGSIYDPSLDRSYEYDNVGRLAISHSGNEARAHAYSGQWSPIDDPYSHGYDYDVWGNLTHRYGWGGEVQGGSSSGSTDITYSYTNNRRNNVGFTYDAAGNVTGGNVTMNAVVQTFTYDVTGQQATATYGASWVQQWYDGNGLRVKKNDNGAVTYYLRSTVLGGQVIAELNGSATWMRGYVYLGSQLLAVQDSGVYWMHEDPVTKSKRVTNSAGAIVSTIEPDPWGADTNRSINSAFQPKKFTSYERDSNGTDEAMFRRYNRWMSRFDQPDPYDGSYDLGDPQSFNRYAYVQNDPVNFVDPTGLVDCAGEFNQTGACTIGDGGPSPINDFFLRSILGSIFGGGRPGGRLDPGGGGPGGGGPSGGRPGSPNGPAPGVGDPQVRSLRASTSRERPTQRQC
jgi:RHS repeat-associated protein